MSRSLESQYYLGKEVISRIAAGLGRPGHVILLENAGVWPVIAAANLGGKLS